MRKEWIRTDEERQLRELKQFYKQQKNVQQLQQISIVERKKNRLQVNQVTSREERIDGPNGFDFQVMTWPNSTHRFTSNLTAEHRTLINNINHSYDQCAIECGIEHIKYYSLERSGLVHFVNDEQQMFRSLINFYRQIPEFRQVSVDDQILLIKCNMTHSSHIHYLLKSQFVENTHVGYLMSCWIGASFYSQIARTRRFYDYFVEHPIILKLSLVVMIFTINLSRLPDRDLSCDFTDRSSLFRSQEMYVTLLWNYLHVLFDEGRAFQSMSLVIFQYLRYQQLINEMDLFIGEHFHREQFHPLMKSILRLT
jgi:hypothetical protein